MSLYKVLYTEFYYYKNGISWRMSPYLFKLIPWIASLILKVHSNKRKQMKKIMRRGSQDRREKLRFWPGVLCDLEYYMTPRPSGSQASSTCHVSSEMSTPTCPPFHLHDEGNTDEGTWKLYRVPHKLNRHDYWKLPGILSGSSSSPRMRDKTKGCVGVQSEPPRRQCLLRVCVCDMLAGSCFLPSSKALSYIKALRRGIRCPSMLKTTFSFLGTRKPLFEKGPSTQISSFWSTAQENYRVQTFSFENGNILEAFL